MEGCRQDQHVSIWQARKDVQNNSRVYSMFGLHLFFSSLHFYNDFPSSKFGPFVFCRHFPHIHVFLNTLLPPGKIRFYFPQILCFLDIKPALRSIRLNSLLKNSSKRPLILLNSNKNLSCPFEDGMITGSSPGCRRLVYTVGLL